MLILFIHVCNLLYFSAYVCLLMIMFKCVQVCVCLYFCSSVCMCVLAYIFCAFTFIIVFQVCLRD